MSPHTRTGCRGIRSAGWSRKLPAAVLPSNAVASKRCMPVAETEPWNFANASCSSVPEVTCLSLSIRTSTACSLPSRAIFMRSNWSARASGESGTSERITTMSSFSRRRSPSRPSHRRRRISWSCRPRSRFRPRFRPDGPATAGQETPKARAKGRLGEHFSCCDSSGNEILAGRRKLVIGSIKGFRARRRRIAALLSLLAFASSARGPRLRHRSRAPTRTLRS